MSLNDNSIWHVVENKPVNILDIIYTHDTKEIAEAGHTAKCRNTNVTRFTPAQCQLDLPG